jgi:hypothetical protein
MCAAVCTNRPNTGEAIRLQCTPVLHPQRPNTEHTVINGVIHKPIPGLAAPSPNCPQNAQPLLLLLRSLRCFFFEVHRWGRLVAERSRNRHLRACRHVRVAFKLASDDLRLFFDSRCGRRRITRQRRSFRGPHASGGSRLATGFEVLVGEGTLWTWRRQELASPT